MILKRFTGIILIILLVGWAGDQARSLSGLPAWLILIEALCILLSAGAIVSSLIRDRLA